MGEKEMAARWSPIAANGLMIEGELGAEVSGRRQPRGGPEAVEAGRNSKRQPWPQAAAAMKQPAAAGSGRDQLPARSEMTMATNGGSRSSQQGRWLRPKVAVAAMAALPSWSGDRGGCRGGRQPQWLRLCAVKLERPVTGGAGRDGKGGRLARGRWRCPVRTRELQRKKKKEEEEKKKRKKRKKKKKIRKRKEKEKEIKIEKK